MTPACPLQLNDHGRLRHFLSLDGLPRELLTEILDTADSFLEVGARAVKKVPLMRGMTVCNVFFENSTRTRTTFELAAKRLSADVITLNVSTSSTSKGETLTDTLRTLEAMAADMFVMRHADSGAAHFVAEQVTPNVAIINGGDGRHAHPTQGMLDMLTIRRHKGDFSQLKVAIVGDILHSRVARSNMIALKTLGCPDIRVIAPKTLLPAGLEQYGVNVYTNVEQGLKDVDTLSVITSADRRWAAISKVVRVRVEFSKKILNTDLPRSSGTFFTSRSFNERKDSAVSRMCVSISRDKPSKLSRCCNCPSAVNCGLRALRKSAHGTWRGLMGF